MKNAVKKFFFIFFLLTANAVSFFVWANSAQATDSSYMGLIITEIMYNPAGSNTEHAKWVEFTNLSSNKITLSPTGSKTTSGWKIKDLKITDSSNHYLYTQENTPTEIKPGDFLIVANNLINFSNDYPDFENVPILKSAITLTTSGPSGNYNLTLFDNTFALDTIAYSKDWYENSDGKGKSLEKIELSGNNEKENWQESCKTEGTPGEELEICETETDTAEESSETGNSGGETGNTGMGTGEDFSSAAEKVYLNEILPNPKGGSDDEYIEIASGESEPVDLFGWRIKDGSKSKGYQFKEHIVLNSGEYFAIYRPDSKIALNNSDESVNLYNSQGEVVSSAAFDKSPKNASFNFDGENWKWSKYLTPGKKNKFDSEPTVKINKPKRAYKDLYTEFSTKAKDKETKNLKYVWDFGDGKKSYLAKTSHKYLAAGKYTVRLSVTDDSQTVEKKFTLNVKKYPRPNLEIVKIIPNPAGEDAEKEIVEIKSNSSKKIDLAGWKIATGSGDKMNNHPIGGEISLEPNGTKTITREICKFSLDNKAGKIQLAMPDGKVIDEVEYQKEKTADDEAYVKIDDKWQWIAPNALAETDDSEETGDFEDTRDEGSDEQSDGEILGATDENQTYYAQPKIGYTSEDEFIFLKFFGLLDYKPIESNFCPLNSPAADFIAFKS